MFVFVYSVKEGKGRWRNPESQISVFAYYSWNRCTTNPTKASGLPTIDAAVANLQRCPTGRCLCCWAAGHLCCIRRDEEEVQSRDCPNYLLCSIETFDIRSKTFCSDVIFFLWESDWRYLFIVLNSPCISLRPMQKKHQWTDKDILLDKWELIKIAIVYFLTLQTF